MATKTLISGKRRGQEEEERTPNHAEEEQSDEETGSDSESGAAPLVPPKKPKFITPKPLGPEPVENGSACSSPSASDFIIMPSQKHSGVKKKKASASKLFGDDDVITLLERLSDFWGNGKNNKWAEFHLFVKDDLRNHFTKIQVSEKIRALKKKFIAISERARVNGGRLDLSDAHESVVYELSKALWGDEVSIAPEKGQMAENNEAEEANDMSETEEGSNNVKKRKQENGEGCKRMKKKKQLNEHGEVNKKISKREHGLIDLLEEGDVRDAANTMLSIKNMGSEHGEGNKEMRKVDQADGLDGKALPKGGIQVDELNDKELPKEGIQVNGHDEATKIPSKRKRVDKNKRKMKKRKQVSEHVDKKESLKEVNQHDENEELTNEGKRADEYEEQGVTTRKQKQQDVTTRKQKQIDGHVTTRKQKQVDGHVTTRKKKQVDGHVTTRKQKQVDGHEVKKDSAKQGKQVDDHHEEDNIPANQKQEKKISAEVFQSTYPLLCASFDIYGYPMFSKEYCLMIGQEKAQELEEKWMEFNAEMHQLELKRLDLRKRDFQGCRQGK